MTGDEVIVHQPRRLHEGVADSRADKTEAALLEILAHRIGFRRGRRHLLHRAPTITLRFSSDKTPDVAVEAAELALHRQKSLRVGDGRRDLEAVAHDAGIFHQRGALLCPEARDLTGIETGKGAAVAFPLLQYSVPGQAGLRPFEDQELEPDAVIVYRASPFAVVIGHLESVAFAPGAAF